MSKIKSFAVGLGDMFYILHGSDNFSIIDCCLPEDEDRAQAITSEIQACQSQKGVTRFISTHPDQDHIRGLEDLDDAIKILNFYCVRNEATKEDDTEDFKHYCSLRDDNHKAFYLYRGCRRSWMNQDDEERGSAGINILWPSLDNEHYKEELEKAAAGESFNNISPIIKYSVQEGADVLWMGDLEKDLMEKIVNAVTFEKVSVLFAPHHGRDTGRVPNQWLNQLKPSVIILGEAPAEELHYYPGYNTISQNTAKDITLICVGDKVHFYVENPYYSVDFLSNYGRTATTDGSYLGTLDL